MVKDIEEDNIGNRVVGKRKPIGIFDLIDPGIREKVGPDAVRNNFDDFSDTRPDFYGRGLLSRHQQLGDLLVKTTVGTAQDRFVLPGPVVLMDLVQMFLIVHSFAESGFSITSSPPGG